MRWRRSECESLFLFIPPFRSSPGPHPSISDESAATPVRSGPLPCLATALPRCIREVASCNLT